MKYKLITATSIVIANMIGTGVFTSLGFQLFDLNNITSIMIMWTLGGIIALLGSFCYAELSSAFPRSGGEYHFLRISMGDSIGFLSGWTSAVVGFAAPIAASAYAFSKYFSRVVPLEFSPVTIAIGIVLLVTVVHCLKVSIGASFQVFFTSGKILLLIIFIIAGLMNAGEHPSFTQELTTGFQVADLNTSGFWVGLIFVSYAYSGWNASSYIIEEIENPVRNVPRSIFIGTLLVTVLYVLINFIFMISAPASEMRGKEEVAHVAANYIFGPVGASIVSAMVSFFLISTIGSMIIVGPRVIKRIAGDYHQFSYFSKDNSNGIPIRAILFQSGIAILLLLTSSFEFIITSIGFVLSIFTTLVAIGLIVLRIKRSEVKRSIKVPFFPVTPILFILFNIWTIGYLFINRKEEVIAGLVFVFFGWLLYLYLTKRGSGHSMKIILPLLCLVTLLSCQSGGQSTASEPVEQAKDSSVEKKEASIVFKIDTELDQRAAQIAGLDRDFIGDSSVGNSLRLLNSTWTRKTKSILNPIKNWVQSEGIYSDNRNKEKRFVFYPFSGPDFEFASTFYPEADAYVLCGLERAGNENSLIVSRDKPVDAFLKKAVQYFYFSDRFGFFRTLDMEKQFEEAGVVDILALYIKRTGSEIASMNLYDWDTQSGTLKANQGSRLADVCSFVFRFPSGKVSTLYYFSKDLSNNGLKNDSLWLKWVEKQSVGMKTFTLVKSASYLMHTSYFSIIREFVLRKSAVIVQDDTGVPYADMVSAGRTPRLYGEYSSVIPIFRNYFQPVLAERYKSDSVIPLPFRIGYNLRHNEACLLVIE